jgi:hypothetical protein
VKEVLAEGDLVTRPSPKGAVLSEDALRRRPSGNGVERFRSNPSGVRILAE